MRSGARMTGTALFMAGAAMVLTCGLGLAIVLTIAARFSDQAATAAGDFDTVSAQMTSLVDGIDMFNESTNRILHGFRCVRKGGG
jgi:hypothetical protein